MRPLVIDDVLRDHCAAVREYAERPENWYRPVQGNTVLGDSYRVPGDRPEHVVRLSSGYRIVFSITHVPEHSRDPFRHLSVSVDGTGYPNPAVVWTIARLLGFTGADAVDGDVVQQPGPWGVALDEKEHCVVVQQPVEGT
jgi:hypothetical protein